MYEKHLIKEQYYICKTCKHLYYKIVVGSNPIVEWNKEYKDLSVLIKQYQNNIENMNQYEEIKK